MPIQWTQRARRQFLAIIDAVLKDMMIPEFGARRMMSPPTPVVRLPMSFMMPVVRPTITRMRVTSSATARMLTAVRTGLEIRFAVIICLFNRSSLPPPTLRSGGGIVCLNEFRTRWTFELERVRGKLLVHPDFCRVECQS